MKPAKMKIFQIFLHNWLNWAKIQPKKDWVLDFLIRPKNHPVLPPPTYACRLTISWSIFTKLVWNERYGSRAKQEWGYMIDFWVLGVIKGVRRRKTYLAQGIFFHFFDKKWYFHPFRLRLGKFWLQKWIPGNNLTLNKVYE